MYIRKTENEAPAPYLFFLGVSETFNIVNYFPSIRTDLAAPKIMYIDTYRIFFIDLSYGYSVKGKNQDSEKMVTIASAVPKLSLGYTDPYLLAEFSQIG